MLLPASPVEPFRPFFVLPDDRLAEHGIVRIIATEGGLFPCRVLLQDARPGETLLLLNYEHMPEASPYRSRHAIFVNEGADEPAHYRGVMPSVLGSRRLMSLRAYDEAGMMIDADIVPGAQVEATALRLLENSAVAYLHAHNAARGCFAARIDRA